MKKLLFRYKSLERKTRHSLLHAKNKASFRRSFWATAFGALLLGCVLVGMHFHHKQQFLGAALTVSDLGYASDDLLKGYLHLRLAEEPNSPWETDQGMALLEHSLAEYERLIALPEIQRIPRIEQQRIELSRAVKNFQAMLGNLNNDADLTGRDLSSEVLRLNRRAAELDRALRNSVLRMLEMQDWSFWAAVAFSIVLLLGLFAFIARTERARDRIERKSFASEALASKYAERSSITLESITDGFFTLDQEWRFTFANSEAVKLVGKSRDQLLGEPIWTAFPNLEGTKFETEYRRVVEEQKKVSFEAYYEGLKIWCRVNAYPTPDGMAVYFQDVTETRRVEHQLHLLETCVSHMNDMVLITEAEPQDEPGPRIVFANEAFVTHTGYSLNEVLGRSPRLLQGPKTNRQELARVRAAMKLWQHVQVELINYTKSGDEFWVEMDLVPISDSQGWYTHWVAVQRDITERRRAEAERARILVLEQETRVAELSSQAKSKFLAIMSHEIRTPINGVLGMVEVLQESSLDGDQQEVVEVIRDSAMSLLAIVDDILDFSKIEADKLELDVSSFSLFQVVKSVSRMLDRVADNNSVELTLFTDPRLPEMVIGDELRLRQILLNLLSNAVKFSRRDDRAGQVTLKVYLNELDAEKVLVEFRIVDNGIGMTEETQARLFSPFVQADASTTRHFGGTGLGLTITRNLVELMNGDIKITSQRGEGSEFRVTLPFGPNDLVCDGEKLPDLSGLNCALLGCEGGLGAELATYLTASGVAVKQVELTPDSIEVESLNNPEHFDLIIVDHRGVSLSEKDYAGKLGKFYTCKTPCLVVARGRRRKPRWESKKRLSVDGNLLDRATFIQAAFMAVCHKPETSPPTALMGVAEGNTLAASVASAKPARNQGRRILVAEDNQTNQKVIQRQLALLGYSADVAADGREALQLWRSQKYALLLTDLHMPELDGYELVQTIRAEQTSEDAPPLIVVLSANGLNGEEHSWRALGISDYLVKPASLSMLKELLERLLPRVKPCADSRSEKPETEVRSLDLKVLRGLVGDEPDVLVEFLQDFGGNASRLMGELRRALSENNLKAAQASAHSFKSSARAMGALTLGDLCEHLERSAIDLQSLEVSLIMTELELELEAVERSRRELLGNF